MKRVTCFFAAALLAGVSVTASEKPNVVFILIDDLSHYGITAYGANRISSTQGFFKNVEFETPRIDSLAKDGMKCDYAYAYPLCEPTRIALMSGMNNIRNYHQCKSQHASDITFGDLFQREDYETCIVGKWKQTRGTKSIPGKDYISEFGWDEFCCFDVVTEGYRMIDPDIVENGEIMNYKGIDPVTGRRCYGPDIFNRYALDFIERNQEKPFFLYYSMVLMHDEHTPTPDTKPASIFDEHDISKPTEYGFMKGDDRRYFPDMLAYADKMVGQVLDQLEKLGLDDNTLVVVMGDNGTKECFEHVLPDGTVFRGDKGSNKEGGLHVPLLLRAPGKIPAGKSYSGMVNLTDILPTLCDAVGIEPPNKEALDGISFWPQVTGKASADHRKWIYTWYNGNNKSSDLDNVVEYAFTKEFKRYAPSKLYPEGRFFDLRTDLFEEAGAEKKKVPKVWNKWHYSGLDINTLTPEQKRAYDGLGKILKQNAYVPVQRLQIVKGEVPLRVGGSKELTCRIYPQNATRRGIIWKSSDSSIASVDKFGVVTGHKKGKVEITAYSWDDAVPLADHKSEEYATDGIQHSVKLTVSK
ncbi:sulfatase-like hydrolase/transferase [Pontiella agarivorans]|uniref:Sulfatase-like hydrolase/transferase n=1 Tax=Pontiella agarivorans TaxID=3038953 RepID=A0ABU5N1T6_9BACT|nr:sulfatase-like hydrolase/transferase [Pontiella agarivorans]MDZ8120331.1 sulfatase-like hydrolase/transferase [Pontiella agarivorans]